MTIKANNFCTKATTAKRNGKRDRRADTSRAKPATGSTLDELTDEEKRRMPKIRSW